MDQDLEKAFQMMFQASKQGLAEAQVSLGLMYERGQGTAMDMNEALYWYQRSATFGKAANRTKSHYTKNLLAHREEQYLHGNRDAQFLLGRLYEEGNDGVMADPYEAVKWYEDAAVRGDVASQARLAVLLGIHGKPKPDQIMAYAWAKLAASNDVEGNFSKPLKSLDTLLSETQKNMGQALYTQLLKQVSYNLQDLNLPAITSASIP